jgi:hypothetical protein
VNTSSDDRAKGDGSRPPKHSKKTRMRTGPDLADWAIPQTLRVGGERHSGCTGNWRFLNALEAADRLQTDLSGVETLAITGQLRAHKWMGRWRFLDCDLDAFVVNVFIQRCLQGKVHCASLPRPFANPWFFRPKRGGSAESPVGTDGRPVAERPIRIGGTPHYIADFSDPLLPQSKPRSRSALYELRRHRAKRLAQYRNSEIFSEEEVNLIAGYFYGVPLQVLGREHGGVSRQAVWERLQRLEARARAAGLPGWYGRKRQRMRAGR